MSDLDRRLTVLLRDYGYEVQGNALISKGIRGFTRDEIVRRVRSPFDAAEQLIPIVADNQYHERFRTITAPKD